MVAEKSVFRYYQKVLALKKSSKAAIYGIPVLYDENDKQIVCFTRTTEDGERLLVFGNFSNRNAKYSLSPEFSKLAKDEVLSNYDAHIVNNGVYTLRPYEAIVFIA